MPASRLPPSMRMLACLAACGAALLAGCGAQSAPATDQWQVRATGHGPGRRIESLSTINARKPARDGALSVAPLLRRDRGAVAIQLHADPAATTVLGPASAAYRGEIDRALDWLSRLTPGAGHRARVELTLVGDGRRLDMRRVHPGREATVVDLAAPFDPDSASAPSAQVGRALATALHEASHALSAGASPALSRDDDEYRAALVESCYLVDTLRPGDTLRLPAPSGARAGEDFIAAASRAASARAVADLARAGGGHTIAWNDRPALLGIKVLCRTRLAMASTRMR